MKRHSFHPERGNKSVCRVCNEPQTAHHHRMRNYRVTIEVSAVYDESSVVRVAKDAQHIFMRGLEPLSDSDECVAGFRIVGVEEARP